MKLHPLTRRIMGANKVVKMMDVGLMNTIITDYLKERAEWLEKQTYPNKYNREEIVDQAFELSEPKDDADAKDAECSFCGQMWANHDSRKCNMKQIKPKGETMHNAKEKINNKKRYRIELENMMGKFKGCFFSETLEEAEKFGYNWTYLELERTNSIDREIRLFTVWEENKFEALRSGCLYNPTLINQLREEI